MNPYYDKDGITIYHGRWQDAPCSGGVIVTDPPYEKTSEAWDTFDVEEFWERFKSDPAIVFTQQPIASRLITSRVDWRHELIWWKNTMTGGINGDKKPLVQHELIEVFGDVSYTPQKRKRSREELQRLSRNSASEYAGRFYGGLGTTVQRRDELMEAFPTTVIAIDAINNRNGERNEHPSQKPVALMAYLIETYSTVSDVILDPFAGSGTTLIAAKLNGRRAVGCEINERYCEIAANRLRQGVLPFAG